MLKWSLIIGFALFPYALAQEPQELPLARTSGASSKRAAEVANDPASAYSTRREAALAALQAGYKAATVEQNRGRAMGYLLVSLHRDHYIPKALYDMGVLCAQDERWRDALSFYRAAQQANPDPQLAQLAAGEIERVQAIEQLESTTTGKKQRQFEISLLAAIKKSSDPFAALVDARNLAKQDRTRWEPLALAGLMRVKSGAFGESAKALEDAARLAPLTQRQKLQSAANLARREADFTEQVKRADELWEKKQYDLAATQYAEAWQNSPDHLDVAREAVTSFLMADQITPAVEILARLRDARSDDLSAKSIAMLKELGSVSEDARREATQERAPSATKQSGDVAERIVSLVGPLYTRQMELTARPNPPLIPDSTPFIPVNDEELTGGHNYTELLSTESVFARYQLDLSDGSVPPAVESKPAPPPDAPPAVSPRAGGPAERQTLSRDLPPPAPPREASHAARRSGEAGSSASAGPLVSVTSNPRGAIVLFDDTTEVTCTAPCRIPLTPGRHTLKATLPGYREALKIFEVDKQAEPVEVTLQVKAGFLYVQTEPSGAAIFLNGKRTDRLTPSQFELPEGDYEVGVQVAGEDIKTQKVPIKDGVFSQPKF